MKTALISLIRLYQLIPGPWRNSCRHIPSCSNYGIEAIKRHGSLKGSYLLFRRIIKCNPWGSHGYDPVPERRMK